MRNRVRKCVKCGIKNEKTILKLTGMEILSCLLHSMSMNYIVLFLSF